MGDEENRGGAGYTINVADWLANDPGAQAQLQALAEARERLLESLSPEKRAEEEARFAAEEQAAILLIEQDAQSYDELVKGAESAVLERHRQIEADRKAGTIGTMTEVGRVYRLSGVAVGRILDRFGLRERVDVDADEFASPLTIALEKFEAKQRERQAAFNSTFRPHRPFEEQSKRERGKLHLPRGVVDGFAIHDHFDGRDHWIAAKLAPILEPHTKRKP